MPIRVKVIFFFTISLLLAILGYGVSASESWSGIMYVGSFIFAMAGIAERRRRCPSCQVKELLESVVGEDIKRKCPGCGYTEVRGMQ
jgi:hypothetical protein